VTDGSEAKMTAAFDNLRRFFRGEATQNEVSVDRNRVVQQA